MFIAGSVPRKGWIFAFEMSETVRTMVRERLHAQHPELDESHLRLALIEELHGISIGAK
jgi:hypothetical protein